MARTKNPAPMRREPSETHASNGALDKLKRANGNVQNGDIIDEAAAQAVAGEDERKTGIVALAVCVGGIYGAFLSWAYLQERITTTTYGPSRERFTYPVFLNTVQSAFAAITGYVYLVASSRYSKSSTHGIPSIFPSHAILLPLLLIAVTSSLASPFGYSSLKYIDYVTFILAKSCKLLPVMFLHVSLFKKKYPIYKYMVVALVTLGVAIFTLHHPSTAKKAAKSSSKGSANGGGTALGLFLLGVNLLFDGLTNTVQDHIFSSHKPYSGPQMMSAMNIMSTLLTTSYLFISPYIAQTGVGPWIGMSSNSNELQSALDFVTKYPQVGWDVLAFSACGAVGQVFIYYTLAHFSSLLLVTVTVTRKMLTMLLSIVLFGHQISHMQWLGVGLVFGGIGAEGWYTRVEKKAKERKKMEEVKEKERKEL